MATERLGDGARREDDERVRREAERVRREDERAEGGAEDDSGRMVSVEGTRQEVEREVERSSWTVAVAEKTIRQQKVKEPEEANALSQMAQPCPVNNTRPSWEPQTPLDEKEGTMPKHNSNGVTTAPPLLLLPICSSPSFSQCSSRSTTARLRNSFLSSSLHTFRVNSSCQNSSRLRQRHRTTLRMRRTHGNYGRSSPTRWRGGRWDGGENKVDGDTGGKENAVVRVVKETRLEAGVFLSMLKMFCGCIYRGIVNYFLIWALKGAVFAGSIALVYFLLAVITVSCLF
eukprot:GHVS01021276.1.p1 GENE.GHVS01021276.1~~GHVS01021276.1.p1  ORF type:complete len:287 (+),score=43.28 GHVS01021276.1:2-862(+)